MERITEDSAINHLTAESLTDIGQSALYELTQREGILPFSLWIAISKPIKDKSEGPTDTNKFEYYRQCSQLFRTIEYNEENKKLMKLSTKSKIILVDIFKVILTEVIQQGNTCLTLFSMIVAYDKKSESIPYEHLIIDDIYLLFERALGFAPMSVFIPLLDIWFRDGSEGIDLIKWYLIIDICRDLNLNIIKQEKIIERFIESDELDEFGYDQDFPAKLKDTIENIKV